MENILFDFGFNIVFYTLLSLLVTYLLKNIIWFFNPIFYLINLIIWFFYNPVRIFLKNRGGEGGRRTFVLFRISLISPIYFICIHVILTPLRLITAIYYDVLVYLSIMLSDLLGDLFKPKLGSYRREHGIKYLFHYIFAFPYRLILFLIRSSLIIIDSLLMFGVSIIFPTLTMYHGTSFNDAGTNIIQNAEWKVGGGDFAGLGVYFAVAKKVAIHYAKISSSSNDIGMLIVRITTTFTRNASTLERDVRNLVGSNGKKLSNKLPFPYSTIEHWRDDLSGWEYCLVQPNRAGKYIKSWRIRPVALIEIGENKKESVPRIWGGISHYSLLPSGIFYGVFSLFILIVFLAKFNGFTISIWLLFYPKGNKIIVGAEGLDCKGFKVLICNFYQRENRCCIFYIVFVAIRGGHYRGKYGLPKCNGTGNDWSDDKELKNYHKWSGLKIKNLILNKWNKVFLSR